MFEQNWSVIYRVNVGACAETSFITHSRRTVNSKFFSCRANNIELSVTVTNLYLHFTQGAAALYSFVNLLSQQILCFVIFFIFVEYDFIRCRSSDIGSNFYFKERKVLSKIKKNMYVQLKKKIFRVRVCWVVVLLALFTINIIKPKNSSSCDL